MKSKWVFCGSVGACVLVRTALVVDTEVKFYCDISVLHSPSCHTHTHTSAVAAAEGAATGVALVNTFRVRVGITPKRLVFVAAGCMLCMHLLGH